MVGNILTELTVFKLTKLHFSSVGKCWLKYYTLYWVPNYNDKLLIQNIFILYYNILEECIQKYNTFETFAMK